MVNDNPAPEPEPPTPAGVHVHVTVHQPVQSPEPAKLRPSLLGYAVVGFVILCAGIGYVAVQLVSAGIVTVGM
jgi:hypothetical protein